MTKSHIYVTKLRCHSLSIPDAAIHLQNSVQNACTKLLLCA